MDLNFWLKMPIYSLIGANTNFWHWIMMTFYNLLPLSLVPIGFRCFMGKLIIFCLMNFYFAKMSKKLGVYCLTYHYQSWCLLWILSSYNLLFVCPLATRICHFETWWGIHFSANYKWNWDSYQRFGTSKSHLRQDWLLTCQVLGQKFVLIHKSRCKRKLQPKI